MSKLLIDADGIVYRAGFAMEKSEYIVTDSTSFIKVPHPPSEAAAREKVRAVLVSVKAKKDPLKCKHNRTGTSFHRCEECS